MKDDFIRIIDQHEGIIEKICRFYCNSIDTREELKQEILFQLWRSFKTFQQRSMISTWIYKVALNCAMTSLKRGKRWSIFELFFEDSYVDDSYDYSDIEDENLAKLYRAISTLKDIDKAIILLHLENSSYQEISEIVGISVKNVSVKLSRIRERIKRKVETYE